MINKFGRKFCQCTKR